ncbi:MAG TPA: nucleotidyltransferase family protein [Allosphingosinicella sp.]|nr:nucleotidyltransferase family protein [Allosphingosinicella sp.]
MARGGADCPRGIPAWTAVILAGRRPGPDRFAAMHGLPTKVLIPVAGEPMLGRVARTLLDCPSVGRVVVLAQRPESLLTGPLGWMAREPQICAAVAGDGISASIMAVAGSDPAPFPLLVTTADHVLLSPEMVEAFISGAGDADAAFGVVRRDAVERSYPDTRRTWLKFADGQYSGANLFAFRNSDSMRAAAFWSKVEKHRKRAVTLLAFFGPTLFLRILTRAIGLAGAAGIAGRRLDLRLRAVVLEHPEAAIDVDKPEDLRLAERILSRRQHAPACPEAAAAAPEAANGAF